MIGHTQPRRIAARSVAERIAEELGSELGETVGYQVRFTDRTSKQSRVKVMTDGILLAELQRDRMLKRYDTLIIDEAHERSLNVDFLLGYVKRLLPQRPDLKLIITSATIDPERFAEHFADASGRPAPIIEVSGPHLPGRGALPPAARGVVRRRGGRARPPGPDRGDRGCGHRAAHRHRRRHPRVPPRGARDPRHGRRAQAEGRRPSWLRHRPAVLPPLLGRAAPRLREAHPASRRTRHQRRRDLADRPRHHRRDRHRSRPDQPLVLADEGAAAADRAGQPGVRAAAVGPLRSHRGGHRDPAVQRGGLPRPAGVHRAGDPAHLAGQRDPADDLARPRPGRAVPVRGPARQQGGAGRRTAAGGARRAGPGSRATPARVRGSPASAASWRGCRSTPGSPG